MSKNSEIANKIAGMCPIGEMELDIIKFPMIGDVCTEMYHKVGKGKPVTTVANGIRIIMYEEE